MIIISNKPGQLGNRLIVYSSFIAFCREFHLELENPAFHDYSDYFEGTSEGGISLFPQKRFSEKQYKSINLRSRFWRRLKADNRWIRFIHLDWDQRMELNKSSLVSFSSKRTYVEGWQFRCNDLLIKHKELLINFFRPVNNFQSKIDDFFANDSANFTIGLHIRRGDYRKFENGRYYYSDDKYKNLVQQIIKHYSDKNIRLIISSNEKIDIQSFSFPGIQVQIGPGHELTDMYCLSKCDLIIGPPSTYSMWASFYGEKPLYMIKNPDESFSPDKAQIITGF